MICFFNTKKNFTILIHAIQDEAALIRILGHRNIAEIEAIKTAYQQKFGKDLISVRSLNTLLT